MAPSLSLLTLPTAMALLARSSQEQPNKEQPFHALPRNHLYRAFDGMIVDASPRGPLHDGDDANERALWLLDAFEAAGKPVVLAVDGVCDEAIDQQTLTKVGVLDPYEPFVSLRERLWPATRAERRRDEPVLDVDAPAPDPPPCRRGQRARRRRRGPRLQRRADRRPDRDDPPKFHTHALLHRSL